MSMVNNLQKTIKQYGRGILVLCLIAAYLVLSQGSTSSPSLLKETNNSSKLSGGLLNQSSSISINASVGQLSSQAYTSKDSSIDANDKVTFGYPNKISFSTNPALSSIQINTGALSNSTPISPWDFGADEIWYDNGYGAQNPSTNQLYPGVIKLANNIGISSLRFPGGIPSDTYHWQNAIGPQNKRSSNVVYQSQNIFFPSNFGPDEFGQLLQSTNAVGDITVNFGTGTAQEAADWVQYMTASSKSNYWGQLRARNGHPAAYKIPYWEVGNEQEASSGENYWRSGSVVSIGSKRGQCKSSDTLLCEYVYGGVTAFRKQAAISSNNQPLANGAPGQTFYAKYPPIVAHSQTVYVNGQVWSRVTNLADSGAGQKVYEIDDSSGKISFGNGIQGAVVPLNANISISYQSGPHNGFIQYYQLMKVADPQAQICSSYESVGFIQLMGSTNPYDCLVSHLYVGGVPATNNSTVLFHNNLMGQSYAFENIINADKSEIKQYAGPRAKDVSLAVTEYGVNAFTSPNNQANYHRSQDMALFVANSLQVIINAHIPIAEKHYLIAYQNSVPSGPLVYVNGHTFANNALIGGPGPNPIAQPSAYVLQAYTKFLYSNLLSSNVINNPTIIYSGGSYPALSTVATTDKKGREAVMIINLSDSKTITANLNLSSNSSAKVNSWTLGSNSYLAYNTPSDPSVVGFTTASAQLKDGKLTASFPPASITVLQLKD